VAGIDDEFPRASYYRGVLARLTGEGDPRELFIDALMDLNLGPRAAVNLVQLRELSPPAVRRALEQAAASGTHMSDVYWALTEIYLDDARRAEETMRLARAATPTPLPAPSQPLVSSSAEPVFTGYAQGNGEHFKYELLSESGSGPKAETVVAPYYPTELLNERTTGRVVLDVQVTEDGGVGGVWLISSTPEVFSGLATAVIREWTFEAVPGKIRVALHFVP
jgi:TonB family protein